MSWEFLLESGTVATAAVALLACTSCALVGSFLVLRRMGLIGDAISHAVLPGLVIGFLVSGSRSLVPMLVGAVAAALLTTVLIELLERRMRVEASTGMGVVFTTMFAIGVLLFVGLGQDGVHLDPDCVLHGQLGIIAFQTISIGGLEIPRATVSLGLIALIDLAFILLLWKELKITSFDPALARTLGISTGVVHYILMMLVAGTTVACFEAVGSILVIAMLIVPGATAHLLTDRLGWMVAIAVAVGWISAVVGCVSGAYLDVSEAGMITVVSGILFAGAVFVGPHHGLLPRWFRRLELSLRILEEDILARLYRLQESGASTATGGWLDSSVPHRGWSLRWALWRLARRGSITRQEAGYLLTPVGSNRARSLVRSHRAWETFLDRLGHPSDHLHEPAHRMEHFVDERMTKEILEGLDHPQRDPHGRDIPE